MTPIEISTAHKVAKILEATPYEFPSGSVYGQLTADEAVVAIEKRWIVPSQENLGYFQRGPGDALAVMMEYVSLSPSGTPSTPAAAAARPVTDPDKDQLQVGDDVEVVDNGKTFTGKVGALNPDGTYTPSFDGARPSRTSYKPTEIRRLPAKPGEPASNMLSPKVPFTHV